MSHVSGGNMVVGFLGAGNMGGAYIKALNKEVFFYEPNKARVEELEKDSLGKSVVNLKELIDKSDIIVIGVKPQILDKVLVELKEFDLSKKILVTMVVGVKIKHYEKYLGELKLVRTMPNTPVQVKEGVAGVSFKGLDEKEKDEVLKVLGSCGLVLEIEEEKLDAITAISGSGPAYIFLLINALADGGVRLGLSKAEAIKVASQTFLGAAKMVLETGMHPEVLKDMVTSPGGTTAQGLAKMEEYRMRSGMIETAKATYDKAKELGRKE